MTSYVYLAVYDGLTDWETGHAVAHLNDPEHQRVPGRYAVRTVAASAEPITTMGGVRILPDITLDDLDPAAGAMLILPGAPVWESGGNGEIAAAASTFVEAGVPVAAICGATLGLAREGLLDDRRHTSNGAEYLASSGYAGAAHYVEDPAVTDRGVITAGALYPVQFAAAIFETLDVYTPGVLEAWTGLFSTGDPSWFPRLMQAASP
jgi:putative intracellular protease/amidase